jgi:hypothetical protein
MLPLILFVSTAVFLSQAYLTQPHAAQVVAIFRLLGFDNASAATAVHPADTEEEDETGDGCNKADVAITWCRF